MIWYEDDSTTVYQGDPFEIMPTLAPERAALVLTDVPYMKRARKQPDVPAWDARTLLRAFDMMARLSYRWVISTVDDNFTPLLKKRYIQDLNKNRRMKRELRWVQKGMWVVSNKTTANPSDRPSRGWEPIVMLHRPGTPLRWNGDGRPAVYITPLVRVTGHPTEKPRKLLSRIIQQFTDPGDLVIDPFMGGGSVLRVAKDLGRRAIGIEQSQKWCDTAVKHLRQDVLPLDLPPDLGDVEAFDGLDSGT